MMKVVNIFEEGFKELLGRLKRSLTKSGRAANVNDKHLNSIRKAMVNEFNAEDDLNELKAYKQWVQDCITSSKESLESTEDKNLRDVILYHINWMTKFLKDVDKKIESVQESYEVDEYVEEGFKDILMTIKRSFTQEGRNRNQIEKVLNKSRKEMKKRVKEASLEQLKEYSENLKNSIEHNRKLLETEDDRVVKATMQDHNKWLENLLSEIESKITKLQESFEMDVDDEYLEEGLFSKKTEVEIEVIYDDWEAHCSAYAVDDSVRCLKSVTIDLPEEFHSGSDKSDPKGNWEEALIKVAKKATKKDFKEFKIKRWFVH